MGQFSLCHLEVLRKNALLFEGTSQYSRYSRIFEKACSACQTDLKTLGFEPGDFGTHSCRKGVIIMIASGCTVSPPIAPICIRAGWVIGGPKDKYVFHESAGDQYVGRCASCLSQLDKEFACSPPYFDFTALDTHDRITRKRQLRAFIASRLHNYSEVTPKALHLLTMCFASICYHFRYLQSHTHESNYLRQSPLFRDIPKELLSLAVVKFPWNKTLETPVFSGIPPHIVNIVKMEKLELEIKALRTNIKKDLEELMDQRGFSSTAFNTDKIVDAVTKKAQEAIDKLLKDNRLLQTPTEADDEVETEDYSIMEEDIDPIDYNDLTVEERATKQKEYNDKTKQVVKKRKFTVGFHHGKLSPLPATFKWPKMTTFQLCVNWLIGNVEESIPPYCTLTRPMLSHDQKLCSQFPSMRVFMRYIECAARREEVWVEKTSDWTYDKVFAMWNKVADKYIFDVYAKDGNRKKALSWKTLYNKMLKQNAFNNNKIKRTTKIKIHSIHQILRVLLL